MTTTTAPFPALPIAPAALEHLRVTDDAGRPVLPFTDDEGGAPLRCCLSRSALGERIALLTYAPLRRWAAATGTDPGPYDEQGPVFVHAEPCPGPAGDAVPFATARRVVRRYDAKGRILGGRLVEDATPEALTEAFREALDDPSVAVVHVRAVEYGCFLYEVTRATGPTA